MADSKRLLLMRGNFYDAMGLVCMCDALLKACIEKAFVALYAYAAKRRSLADTEAARKILTASGMRKGRTVTGNVAM